MKNFDLIKMRENAGLTQLEIANRVGITERSYQRYEAGERTPNVYIGQLIAEVLDSTLDTIFPSNLR